MAITINGSSNTITGLAAGGLPDASIQAADLASGVGGKILQVVSANLKTAASGTNAVSYTHLTMPTIYSL